MSQRRETTISFMFFGVNKEKIYTIGLKKYLEKRFFPIFLQLSPVVGQRFEK